MVPCSTWAQPTLHCPLSLLPSTPSPGHTLDLSCPTQPHRAGIPVPIYPEGTVCRAGMSQCPGPCLGRWWTSLSGLAGAPACLPASLTVGLPRPGQGHKLWGHAVLSSRPSIAYNPCVTFGQVLTSLCSLLICRKGL